MGKLLVGIALLVCSLQSGVEIKGTVDQNGANFTFSSRAVAQVKPAQGYQVTFSIHNLKERPLTVLWVAAGIGTCNGENSGESVEKETAGVSKTTVFVGLDSIPDSPIKFGNNLGHEKDVSVILDYAGLHRSHDATSETRIRGLDRNGLTLAEIDVRSTLYPELNRSVVEIEVQQQGSILVQAMADLSVMLDDHTSNWKWRQYSPSATGLDSALSASDILGREWFIGNQGYKTAQMDITGKKYYWMDNVAAGPRKIVLTATGANFGLSRTKFLAALPGFGEREIVFSADIFLPS